ncbi:hypothetical protein DAPPUDRAFT_318800 [Daphnia pulex]|uniref:Uncharacterized protein n=1 Tax=Daphnia pulex TaxID=6669 RepID=E9GJQ0_DAPPU|nr:hypothetical protein DAPPUDRAFT_318800 [Daphnia pulex]|eukprot:EFX80280.1 hypothetical protein DAPPUDRAFT_318800 [Daphnia pulex]
MQLCKFKSFFAKLEKDAISVKTEKALMSKKIEKLEKEVASRITLRSDLMKLSKKDLVIAQLSLADKDIRLFELQNSGKAIEKQHPASPDKEGPVVQQLKKHSDNSVKLFFRDEQNRAKARELLDQPEAERSSKMFMCRRIATQPFKG